MVVLIILVAGRGREELQEQTGAGPVIVETGRFYNPADAGGFSSDSGAAMEADFANSGIITPGGYTTKGPQGVTFVVYRHTASRG